LILSLKNAFTQADYAIRAKIDPFFSNTRSGDGKLTIRTKYSIEENNINNERFYLEQMFNTWETNTESLGNKEPLPRRVQESKANLLRLQSFLKDLAYVFHDITPSAGTPQAKIDTWVENINVSRTNINTALSTVTTAHDIWNQSQQSLSLQNETLDLKEAGSTGEQIAIAQARVKSAEAQVQYIQAQIAKTVISAPIDGVITHQEGKPGEVISLNGMKEILISMVGEVYEIELNVPEIDISKIKIGDLVLLQFDAFDNHTFESQVSFIEPGETVVQGVVYYQVKIELDPKEIPLEIRSGMSVDVDIITEQKENVIVVPQRFVSGTNGDKSVPVLKEDGKSFSIESVPVKVGFRGENGLIEITEGLEEGMKVVKPE
jgi:HlyD family secretion protein